MNVLLSMCMHLDMFVEQYTCLWDCTELVLFVNMHQCLVIQNRSQLLLLESLLRLSVLAS